MGELSVLQRITRWLAGFCIYRAVWFLRMAGNLTPDSHFKERIRGALRGLWDAGLASKDIDGGPADLIPEKLKSY